MIHELTPAETAVIVRDLAHHDPPLHVLPDLDERHVLHLWAQQEMTTAEEVFVLGAFLRQTDSPIRWHAAATP
jgi:hypothetical protein